MAVRSAVHIDRYANADVGCGWKDDALISMQINEYCLIICNFYTNIYVYDTIRGSLHTIYSNKSKWLRQKPERMCVPTYEIALPLGVRRVWDCIAIGLCNVR